MVIAAWACGACETRAPARPELDAASPDAAAAVDGQPTADVVAASAFCARLRDQEASWRARCLGGTAKDWRDHLELATSCAEVGALVAGGTVRYQAALADACLAENAAERSCSRYQTLCATHVLAGTLPVDAPCKDDFECPPDAGCWAAGEFSYNACMPSTCVHLPDKAGDACNQEPFPYCFAGLSCINVACVPRPAEGQPCGVAACQAGSTCDGSICRTRIDGGPCGIDADCIPTQYCFRTEDLGGVCVPRGGIGASCSPGVQECEAFSVCKVEVSGSGTCIPAGHPGQPCAQIDGHVVCTQGICLSGTCSPKVQNGGECLVGSECASQGCSGVFCKPCN